MDIRDYSKIVNAVEMVKALVDEDTSQAIIDTMERSFVTIEEFCQKEIPGFSRLENKVVLRDGELSQEFVVYVNNEPLEDLSGYSVQINQLLNDVNNDIGWGVDEN